MSLHQSRWSVITAATTVLLVVCVGVASAHDLFLRPFSHFVAANSDVLVRVLNGTFSRSENAIARTRLRDVSIVRPGGRDRVDTAAWTVAGDTSTFSFHASTSGTYVVGVSTNPNVIALDSKEFNAYLRDDGVPDVLMERRRFGELEKPVRERYAKHVKALIQVGAARSSDFATELGYPAEIVPLENPYKLAAGASLRVKTLVERRAEPNQFVLYGGRTPAGDRIAQRSVRSNPDGVASVRLRQRGTWYVKFISMRRVANDTVDYESKWATLTFQVR